MQGWNGMLWLKLPPPTIQTVPQNMSWYNQWITIYKLRWLFFWNHNVSRLKTNWAQEGHTNPNPRCTCMQIVACEIDGASLQPSTQHLYTLLMPPSWMQRGCMLVGRASSEADEAGGEAASDACVCNPCCRIRDCGCDSCRLLRGLMRDSGGWNVAGFLGRVGLRKGRGVL